MNFKRLMVVLLAAVMLIGLAGPVTRTAQAQSNLVTIAYTQELDNLNRMYTDMFFADITLDLFLSRAWVFDNELNPVPVLVTEIPSGENGGISEDGRTITLHLRDDIVWSDGEPITSADFLFTYEMITAEGNTPITRFPYDPELEIVAGMEAPDAQTVVVNFVEPYAPWVTRLFTYVLPEHVLRPVYEAEGNIDSADWNRAPTVGSGPFVFSEWESGSYILFTRNENYFGEVPAVDGVFIRFFPDDAALVAALVNGDADISTFISYGDTPALEEAGVNVVIVPSGYNEAWFFNVDAETAHPAMLDKNVRRALALAAPFQQISDDLLLGLTYPAASYWENTPYASPNVTHPGYNPEEAARLLDEAGWVDSDGDGIRDKDGVALELRYLTPPRDIRMDTQVVVQDAFTDLGIALILENPSYDIFWNSYGTNGPIATGQFDIAQWSQNPAFPDPDTDVFLCSQIPTDENPEGNNWTGYCNEDLDALFVEQARTTDFDARVALFHQIDELLTEDLVWVGVWHDPDLYVFNQRVLGVAFNGTTPFWNANTWTTVE